MSSEKGDAQENSLDLSSVQKKISDSLGLVEGALDQGINATSGLIKQSVSIVEAESKIISGFAKNWYQVAADSVAQADEAVINTLKKGVSCVIQYEKYSITAGIGIAVLVLPGTRRLLWRATLGRLQNAEAAQRAAEQRLASLTEIIDAQGGEAEKLAERLAAAREEYAKGLAKLKGAASEFRSLANRIDGTEKKASSLMRDLREVRSKMALQMRSEAAVKAKALSAQKNAVDKVIAGLAKDGF